MKTCFQFLFILISMIVFGAACGVKKPPTPAYAMPKEIDPLASPTPTPKPGFSNPSGPLEHPDS